MEQTTENIGFCSEQARRFVSIVRDQPRESWILDESLDALTTTLLRACSSHDVARAVVDEVLSREERWPSPATVRRYMREMLYVEMDVREREDEQQRRQVQRRRQESEGYVFQADLPKRIDRIVESLTAQERKTFIQEITAACNDDSKTLAVIGRYESSTRTK